MKDKTCSPRNVFLKILLFGLLFSLLHIVLERCLSFAASDVALASLMRVLNVGIILCDAVGFFIGYGLLAVSVRFGDKKRAYLATLLLVALTVFRHIGNWGAFLVTDNVTSAIDLRLSFLAAFSAMLIEFFQHAVILLASLTVLMPKQIAPGGVAITFSAVMLTINLISRIISDFEYGAPSSAVEVWVMIAAYLFGILLYGGIGFFLVKAVANNEIQKCAE